MTTKKITKRDRFNALLAIPAVKADPDMVAFIEHELELLAKKNSADKKPTAQQTANEAIKSAIVEAMEADRLYTVTEIQKSVEACADLSNFCFILPIDKIFLMCYNQRGAHGRWAPNSPLYHAPAILSRCILHKF